MYAIEDTCLLIQDLYPVLSSLGRLFLLQYLGPCSPGGGRFLSYTSCLGEYLCLQEYVGSYVRSFGALLSANI